MGRTERSCCPIWKYCHHFDSVKQKDNKNIDHSLRPIGTNTIKNIIALSESWGKCQLLLFVISDISNLMTQNYGQTTSFHICENITVIKYQLSLCCHTPGVQAVVLCHVWLSLLGLYLVCCWHPGGDDQNGILERSARHCTWSAEWVGGLHGTAAPRELCWTAEKKKKGDFKNNMREWRHYELPMHYSMQNMSRSLSHDLWSGDWYGTFCMGGLLSVKLMVKGKKVTKKHFFY